MFDQINDGVKLYLRHFGTLALVGLPIYIPTNLFRAYLGVSRGEVGINQLMQAYDAAVTVFESGVIIATLDLVTAGKRTHVLDVFAIGAKNWLRLGVAVVIVGIIFGIGLLAFVIPGIVCLVRYSFIDSVIVLEELSVTAALRRSWQLTRGCAWWILLVYCIYYPFIIVLGWIPALASSCVILSHEAWLAVAVVHDCIIDLMTPFLTAIMYSFYLHAKRIEAPINAPAPNEEFLEHDLDALDDDGNPYRSPLTS